MTPSPAQTAQTLNWLDTEYRMLLTSDTTNGRQALFESVTQPGGGPPRHIHKDADETFVILSGDVAFWLDGMDSAQGPGNVVFVPRGAEHTFQVIGLRPARMLTILSPGGFEVFFKEMAAGDFRIPQDMAQINKIAERFQLRFTGPPLDMN
jgi:quercetin dioxygenase-like cupin family protein